MRGSHKFSGLSAAIIKRMLNSPQLPPSARKVLLEYVEEKSAGTYGHGHVPAAHISWSARTTCERR